MLAESFRHFCYWFSRSTPRPRSQAQPRFTAWFGIVPPSRLAKAWRHAVFFIALGAAIITPGDGPSMLILSAPLIVLYFISVFVASILWKMRKRVREGVAEEA